MNWLDSAISFISPKLGAKRAAWRNYADELRNYDAGNYGRRIIPQKLQTG